MNLDDRNNKVTHWVSLFIDRNTDLYFDSYGRVETFCTLLLFLYFLLVDR